MIQPFDEVVTEHGATVLRVCRAVLGSHADADDAWSETFLAALKAWPELSEGTDVQAWLVTIAHRKAIDVTRRRRRHAFPVAEPAGGAETADRSSLHHAELWAAVKKLPTKQRQVLAYRYLGGLPYSEIAGLLGGSTDAARRAGADGIARLRTVLDHERQPAREQG